MKANQSVLLADLLGEWVLQTILITAPFTVSLAAAIRMISCRITNRTRRQRLQHGNPLGMHADADDEDTEMRAETIQPSFFDPAFLPGAFDAGSQKSEFRNQNPENPREREIERAFEAADARVLGDYTRFLLEFALLHADFIAGDVTAEFETRFYRLSASQKKALGGVYQRLLKAGEIFATGSHRKRDQGNLSAVYRGK